MKNFLACAFLLPATLSSADLVEPGVFVAAPKAIERISAVEIYVARGQVEPCYFDETEIYQTAHQYLIGNGFEVVPPHEGDAFIEVNVNAVPLELGCVQNTAIYLLQDKGLEEGFFVLAQGQNLVSGTRSFLRQSLKEQIQDFIEQLHP